METANNSLLSFTKFIRRFKYFIQRNIPFRKKYMNDIFTHYYRNNIWGNKESVSGPGSTIEYTSNIRKKIPELIKDLYVKSILDAPCGDYHWFSLIEWFTDIEYIGGDIVKPLIKKNRSLYATDRTKFRYLDITVDPLPTVDLWLCRDCLFHFSYHDIMLTLNNFIKSNINYILTTTFPTCEKNYNIETGSYREINLQLPPFSFDEPIIKIDERIEGSSIKHLALWKLETIKEKLILNKTFQQLLESK